MKEVIDNLIKIDENSRRIMQSSEEKKDNIENYISVELEKKKSEINLQYKTKINEFKKQCEDDFVNKKNTIEENTKNEIKQLQDDYNKHKADKIVAIVNAVIKK